MLEELWKRTRGIDHWPRAQATIHSAVHIQGRRREITLVAFRWKTVEGVEKTGQVTANSNSPFFNISGGETVMIQYDPRRPERFWIDDLGFPAETRFFFLIWGTAAAALLFLLLASV